jgi:C4-dicarboxylate-specific signal transduction histidine kinase
MSDAIEELFQPVSTAKPTVEGTGPGLSISYDITQPHAGTIEVDEFTEFIVQPAVQAVPQNPWNP